MYLKAQDMKLRLLNMPPYATWYHDAIFYRPLCELSLWSVSLAILSYYIFIKKMEQKAAGENFIVLKNKQKNSVLAILIQQISRVHISKK